MSEVAELPRTTRGTGRPNEYKLVDGTRVRGVTTILGRFKESGGLLHWAFQQGKAGLSNLYEKRDEAADIGSLVHGWVEADIHGTELPAVPADQLGQVESAFGAWREWFEGSRMEIVATEVPLVSEQYRYGGTIDAVGRDGKGRLCLVDWKSSNSLHTDMTLQLAAYRHLWNEHHPNEPITDGGFHICRFAKKHGDFEHRFFPDLTDAWEMFKLLVTAYELDKRLKERIK